MARTIAKDHDEKRAMIQRMAAKVFADIGFDRASMSQLSKECGISKAAIYHYYDSKNDLLFDILETHLRLLRDRVGAVSSDGKSPEEYLRAVILEILLAYRGADDHHRVQTAAMGVLGAERQMILTNYQRTLVQQVSAAVKSLAPDHVAQDKKQLRAVTMSLFGMLNWFYMWNTERGIENREQYAKLVGDLFLNGLRET